MGEKKIKNPKSLEKAWEFLEKNPEVVEVATENSLILRKIKTSRTIIPKNEISIFKKRYGVYPKNVN